VHALGQVGDGDRVVEVKLATLDGATEHPTHVDIHLHLACALYQARIEKRTGDHARDLLSDLESTEPVQHGIDGLSLPDAARIAVVLLYDPPPDCPHALVRLRETMEVVLQTVGHPLIERDAGDGTPHVVRIPQYVLGQTACRFPGALRWYLVV